MASCEGGRGIDTGVQTGSYGLCDAATAYGFVGLLDPLDGTLIAGRRYRGEGNIRGSAAVADLDGDGRYEFAVPFGCNGKVRIYDDEMTEKWVVQLGDSPETQRSIASPSIADLDGDGALELVVSAFDGRVYGLGGPTHTR